MNSFINNFYDNDYLIEGKNFNGINFGQVKINWGDNNELNKSYIDLEIYDKEDNLVSDVRVKYIDLLYNNDTTNFYLDEVNIKNIKYMNVYDGKSCEREIHHRFRTPLMNLKYYLTNTTKIPIAIIISVFIIIFCELLFNKRIIYILFAVLISFIIYCIYYLVDLENYNNFKGSIQNS